MNYFNLIKENNDVNVYLKQADKNFAALGYTEQGIQHAQQTATLTEKILSSLNFTEAEIDIAKTAAYLHDIGCAISYTDHAQNGAIMSYKILNKLDIKKTDILNIASIIGSHEDTEIIPVSKIASSIIIADKTDVRRERVIKTDFKYFDRHDRVHYAVTKNVLTVLGKENKLVLNLTIDDKICSVIEYFEIFMSRIEFCRHASSKLGLNFDFYINEIKYL